MDFSNQMSRKAKIFAWLQGLVLAFGGGGLFVVTFFDSSVLSFPFFPDAMLIQLCAANPARMPYYALMAALGSLAGCVVLYFLAKKGGEAFFHKHAGGKAAKIKEWVEGHAFLSAFIPALLPPPFPFKPFILAEGVFQVPARTFIMAILLGRGLRYGVEGILAVRYGGAALIFLKAHGAAFALGMVGAIVLLWLASHFLLHQPEVKS
ncbi:MAG TPA: VTT domain-containing protein [Candidatus Acidoferrales bacterium]